MSDDFLLIQARIHLLTAAEGGRRSPLRGESSYRPNHNFYGPEGREMCVGAIDLAEGEVIQPGETIERDIGMWIWPDLKSRILPGCEWLIQEGAQVVGRGTVLAVLAPD
jgi:translation elongation factor EF-Tu-like GTPase